MEVPKGVMKIDPEKRAAYRRPFQEILDDLAQQIPPEFLSKKDVEGKGSKKGYTADYISWPDVLAILDQYAPGYEIQVHRVDGTGRQTIITLRLIIHAAEGNFSRDACGIANDDIEVWGDTASNSYAKALRRALGLFGGGRYLWDRKYKNQNQNTGRRGAGDTRESTQPSGPVSIIDKKLNAVLERFPRENAGQEKALVAEALSLKVGKLISELTDQEKEQLHMALLAKLRANAPKPEPKQKKAG